MLRQSESAKQGAKTDARWRDKCKVRTPMQDGGANTNANSNGPKWPRMDIYYNLVLWVGSVFAAFGVRTQELCSHIDTN